MPGRLPFLLKVLAAGAPLSLQAHPTPAQAEAGFARENAAGIPLDAPERNYKDAFHKPELIYALSDPFTALSGSGRSPRRSRCSSRWPATRGSSRCCRASSTTTRCATVFTWLISRGPGVDDVISAVVECRRGGRRAVVGRPCACWPSTTRATPASRSRCCCTPIALRPGEVLYLPAGNIHAYLGGLGIELMAASDNVLRGGLTPKHVDVPELLEVLDFRPLPAPYLRPDGARARRARCSGRTCPTSC